jgi:heme-degrading monooxygenase HmoA
MYETTVTYTRENVDEDWFMFSMYDKDLLYSVTRFRNETINAPGFMALTVTVSDDKLQMKLIVLWESFMHAQEFFTKNKFGKAYSKELKKYLGRTHTKQDVTTLNLPDTAQLKAKKLSSRLTVEAGNQTIKEFFTKETKERFKGEHALFLTDDILDDGNDDNYQ